MTVRRIVFLVCFLPVLLFSNNNFKIQNVIFITPKIDKLWVEYLLVIQNLADQEKLLEFSLLIPKKASEVQPMPGHIHEKDLTLDSKRNFVLKKNFSPGRHIIGFFYQVPSKYGSSKWIIPVHEAVQTFVVSAPKNIKVLSSSFSKILKKSSFLTSKRHGFKNTQQLMPQTDITVIFTGVPKGRRFFWLLGSIATAYLFFSLGIASFRYIRKK